MQGNVSTENNGGFVQIALSLSDKDDFDASAFAGIEMEVAGNNEDYNIHFRTSDLWFPMAILSCQLQSHQRLANHPHSFFRFGCLQNITEIPPE